MPIRGKKTIAIKKNGAKIHFFVISAIGRELSCLLGLLLDPSQAQNDTKIYSLGSKKKIMTPDSHN